MHRSILSTVQQSGLAGLAVLTLLLAGCSSRPLSSAPVEDRGTGVLRSGSSSTAAAAAGEAIKPPLLGAENAGKPGYYSVKPGDTLLRIALETGQNFRDIVRWNSLENPNLIEVGQVLRIVPPLSDNALVVTRPVTSGMAITTTAVVPVRPASAASSPASASASGSTAVTTTSSAPAPAGNSPQPAAAEDDVAWIWPAQGKLIAGFDEVKNKGYDIDGKAGDPIIAAGDGRVVYAGAGLRGYGNLIILKHNNTYLTAYAHNQTLLVKEDQTVKKGQKIAEMGNSDADRVKLHFEIRRQGRPVDPSRYLPAK